MHKYELVVILQADLEEAVLDAAVENVETLIKSNEGEITKIDRSCKRKLANPIITTNEGHYLSVEFDNKPAEAANLKRTMGFNEQVLRSSVIRVD